MVLWWIYVNAGVGLSGCVYLDPELDFLCIELIAPCKRTQHCWPTTPNIVGCYMLRPFAHPVACCSMLCCCAKFETGQTFQPTTPNISFVPWSPKRSATMFDPFAPLPTPTQQLSTSLAQQCWELLLPFARSLTSIFPLTRIHCNIHVWQFDENVCWW